MFTGERVFAAAIAAGALSVDALKGSVKPFDPRISRSCAASPARSASPPRSRGLLDGSEILASHVDCGRVQDPYSFRCQPQVMGAALDLLQNAARTLTIEAGAVTDNPIVFPDEDSGDLGRQFPRPAGRLRRRHDRHGAVRGRLDLRAAHSVLVDPKMSGLPAFLTEDQRRQFGPDDPAGHRRRAGQREQEPRFPGQRRFDPDLGRPGGPCLDGADRRAQGGADRAQRRRRGRGRADRRRRRASTTTRRSKTSREAAGRSTPRCARIRRISLPTVTGPTKWRALQAAVLAGEIGAELRSTLQLTLRPALVVLQMHPGQRAAAHVQSRSGRPGGWSPRRVHVALGDRRRLALVDAVARRPDVVDRRACRSARVPLPRCALACCFAKP